MFSYRDKSEAANPGVKYNKAVRWSWGCYS